MNADLPSFSVLMPFYAGDRPEQVEQAFRSVTVDQHLRPDEVVLVQDGPVGDDLSATVAGIVAGSVVPVRLVTLSRNSGLAEALAAGLAEVAHDVVARMDADDVSVPERFAVQIPRIAAGLDVVGSAITEFGDAAGTTRTRPVPQGAEAIAQQARLRSPFHHPSVVYRASAVAAAGGYRDLAMLEDYWLWARMLMAGAQVDNVPDALVLYRIGDGAYGRRGGWALLRSELALQAAFARIGFTTPVQRWRNVAVRGIYRLVPERLRKLAYRAAFARRSG
ncbi:glycosyltransferase, group 2 family protein [Aeromicrobium marinum DSM 15272]|uniref:Glycosyltransferase, group 2 family protein n=1 Tax=Aeromicrobium marinum DSM 15272 TaxID=585531 RepID=E2SB61_9ACTN|nr:glycosyltransferase [Aeromicrobium marinum]EFQ83607.1 glycosyltransferase, group 2 family protein [Aeromicrobium marinum DSM 15272]